MEAEKTKKPGDTAVFRLLPETIAAYLASQEARETPPDRKRYLEAGLRSLYEYLPEDRLVTKERLQAWRQWLKTSRTPRIASGYLAAVNGLLRAEGQESLCLSRGQPQDLTNAVFGFLTVLGPTEKRAVDRSRCWRCRCACGREIEVPVNKLRSGNYTSCGCQRSERLQETNGYVDGTCLKLVMSDVIHSNNTSGTTGVFRKRDGWAAQIQYKKKIYYLGQYKKKEDAIRARKEAEAYVKDDAAELWERLYPLRPEPEQQAAAR